MIDEVYTSHYQYRFSNTEQPLRFEPKPVRKYWTKLIHTFGFDTTYSQNDLYKYRFRKISIIHLSVSTAKEKTCIPYDTVNWYLVERLDNYLEIIFYFAGFPVTVLVRNNNGKLRTFMNNYVYILCELYVKHIHIYNLIDFSKQKMTKD